MSPTPRPRDVDLIVPMPETVRAAHPPVLLIVYHVEKTGGTNVMEWLKRNIPPRSQGLQRRLSGVVDYSAVRCFFATQFGGNDGVLPDYSTSAQGCKLRVADPTLWWSGFPKSTGEEDMLTADRHRGLWKRLRIAAEFHSGIKGDFLKHVAPRMAQLRAAYAEVNGTVLTMTLVREPVAHLISAYRMWPPMLYHKARSAGRQVAQEFPEWAAGARAAQVGLFALRPGRAIVQTAFAPEWRGMHNPAASGSSWCGSLPQARETLRMIDLVVPTDCMALLYPSVVARLRLPHDPAQRRNVRDQPTMLVRPISHLGHGTTDPLATRVLAWSAAQLNESERQALHEVTRDCDDALYRDALERGRALRVAYRGQLASTCARALESK